MIPIGDAPGRRRSFPIVTLTLLVANIAAFVWQVDQGPGFEHVVAALGITPYELTTGRDLPPPAPIPVQLTLFTAMFLHANLLHLGGNMLYLWVFGDNVEDRMGHMRFVVFYLLSGLGGSLVHIATDPLSRIPSIGASGAIAGVLAGYLVLFPKAPVRTLLFLGPFITVTRVSAFLLIGLWFLVQLLSGLAELGGSVGGGVAFWAHIGGFVVGLFATPLLRRRQTSRDRPFSLRS